MTTDELQEELDTVRERASHGTQLNKAQHDAMVYFYQAFLRVIAAPQDAKETEGLVAKAQAAAKAIPMQKRIADGDYVTELFLLAEKFTGKRF